MFSQTLSRVLIASILLGTSISTSFAQNNNSDFIKIRNSYPFWNGSLKRDIQGFKPGMTESEAKQRLSDCAVSGHKVFCPESSKDEGFELSLTEHTMPRLVKDVTYFSQHSRNCPTGDADQASQPGVAPQVGRYQQRIAPLSEAQPHRRPSATRLSLSFLRFCHGNARENGVASRSWAKCLLENHHLHG